MVPNSDFQLGDVDCDAQLKFPVGRHRLQCPTQIYGGSHSVKLELRLQPNSDLWSVVEWVLRCLAHDSGLESLSSEQQ